MKRFHTILWTVLLAAVLASFAACSGGYFVDPEHGGGGGGGDGGGGTVGAKPGTLGDTASYQDALDKLDAIIEYCGTSTAHAGAKANATTLKSTIETTIGSSGWSSASTVYIPMINAIINGMT
jgi:hypothetical protein